MAVFGRMRDNKNGVAGHSPRLLEKDFMSLLQNMVYFWDAHSFSERQISDFSILLSTNIYDFTLNVVEPKKPMVLILWPKSVEKVAGFVGRSKPHYVM